MKYMTKVGDKQYEIEIARDGEISVDGKTFVIDYQMLNDSGVLSMLINNRSIETVVEHQEEGYDVLINGEIYRVEVQDERAYRLATARGEGAGVTGEAVIKSPMPGLIVKTPVADGDSVSKGDSVIILESMKMENELKAPRDGIVKRVHVEPGASVEKGQALVTIGDAEDAED